MNVVWRGGTGPDGREFQPIRGGVSGRVLFGLVLLGLGVLWTLDNLVPEFDAGKILDWWPAIIVAVGLAKLLGVGTRRNLVMGGIFTLIGSLILGDSLDVLEFSVGYVVPLVLIVIGASLVFRSRMPQPAAPLDGSVPDPSATIDSFAMWSGNVHKSTSPAFRGGDATAVMGGVDLDLRNARIAPDNAVIEVFTWWGGIEIRVAPNTRVVNQATAFMGGIEDSSQPGDGSGGTLVLKGLVVMGGVDIKN